jgi:DNA polymerase-3 subunit epsilon
LPPNLPKEEFDKLPAKGGRVLFYQCARPGDLYRQSQQHQERELRVISLAMHASGAAQKSGMKFITSRYELTGNELIALILESQEIRRFWPRYNMAQKYKVEDWGIYDYEDRSGYHRFNVNMVTRGSHPLIRFSTKGDAWNFLWEKVREFNLCPKLSGLQVSKGLCFQHQTGECKGACMGIESVKKYNKRAIKAIASFKGVGETVAILGKGRNTDERGMVLVEKGVYVGFGFVEKDTAVGDFETARRYVKAGIQTPTVQNLINSILINPRGAEVIQF